MGFRTIDLVLAADVATAGTITGIAYPSGQNQASYTGNNASAQAVAIVNDNDVYKQSASKIGVAYGASTITLTNSSGVTWPAGSTVTFQTASADAAVVTVVSQPAIADFAALTDSPATADALRDDLVANWLPKLNTLLAELRAAKVLNA